MLRLENKGPEKSLALNRLITLTSEKTFVLLGLTVLVTFRERL